MASGFVPLPAFRGGGGLDFSGLNEGLDFLIKQNEKNRLLAQSQAIGQALLAGQTGQPQGRNALLGAPEGRPSPAAQAQASNLTQQYSPSQGPSSPASGAFAAAGRDYQPDTPEIAMIKGFEGYTPNAQPDFKQTSIGYGSRAEPGQTTIDRGTAEERLRSEVAPLRSLVDSRVPNANPQQRAALIDAGYNLGPGKGGLADFIPQAAAGDWGGTANRLLNYDHAGGQRLSGLTTRRAQEAAMLTGGSAPAASPQQQAAPSAAPAAPIAAPGPNYDAAIAVAASQGNLPVVAQLTALKQQADATAYERQRQGSMDAQTTQLNAQKIQEGEMALHDRLAMKAASIAQTIETQPEAMRAGLWAKFVGADPRIAQNLVAHGIDPSDHATGSAFMIAEARGLTDKAQYTISRQGVLNTHTGEIKPLPAGAAGSAAEYGTSTKAYEDADGSIQYMQFSKAGGGQPVKLPEGAKWRPDVEIKDVGTGLVPISRQTGEAVGPAIPKNLAAAEAQKATGKATGEAIVDLPRMEATAGQTIDLIEKLKAHPGRQLATGTSGILPGIPGTQQQDFLSLLDQAKGKAFLEAFGSLKGGGQITEVEGKKATDAIARLDRTQSEEGFLTALSDLESVVYAGVARARLKARGPGSGAVPATGAASAPEVPEAPKTRYKFNPATGELE